MVYFHYLKGNVFVIKCQEPIWPNPFLSRHTGFPARVINSFSL